MRTFTWLACVDCAPQQFFTDQYGDTQHYICPATPIGQWQHACACGRGNSGWAVKQEGEYMIIVENLQRMLNTPERGMPREPRVEGSNYTVTTADGVALESHHEMERARDVWTRVSDEAIQRLDRQYRQSQTILYRDWASRYGSESYSHTGTDSSTYDNMAAVPLNRENLPR